MIVFFTLFLCERVIYSFVYNPKKTYQGSWNKYKVVQPDSEASIYIESRFHHNPDEERYDYRVKLKDESDSISRYLRSSNGNKTHMNIYRLTDERIWISDGHGDYIVDLEKMGIYYMINCSPDESEADMWYLCEVPKTHEPPSDYKWKVYHSKEAYAIYDIHFNYSLSSTNGVDRISHTLKCKILDDQFIYADLLSSAEYCGYVGDTGFCPAKPNEYKPIDAEIKRKNYIAPDFMVLNNLKYEKLSISTNYFIPESLVWDRYLATDAETKKR